MKHPIPLSTVASLHAGLEALIEEHADMVRPVLALAILAALIDKHRAELNEQEQAHFRRNRAKVWTATVIAGGAP